MHYETITVSNREGVLMITLNREARLNAWTYQMGRELHHAISSGNDQDEVIAMVMTGAGRGFCAGADIIDLFQAQADGDSSTSVKSIKDSNKIELTARDTDAR